MKKHSVVPLLVLVLTLAASANKHPNSAAFNLTAHITAVNMEQGYRSSGRVSSDDDGKVSGSSSGGTYDYHVFTVKLDGSPITYKMKYFCRFHCYVSHLHIGDYKAYWKKDGVLEVIITDDKGGEKATSLTVAGEQN
ncbi:MAG: hypothetical protein WA609_02760 [Terriglobales bacterium]